jgi:hypothetical protein
VKLFLIGSICILGVSSAFAEVLTPWREYSNPSIMSASFERTFDKLPLSASLIHTQKFWANDYWPRKRGGINYRWNAVKPSGFNLRSPSRSEALNMSAEALATLAPSEKLDLLNGNYDYPLKKEVDSNASPSAPIWHGICNGWAPAALNHNEPLPKTVINPDGVAVPFGSSDIKALLSYYYAYKHKVNSTHQMGLRCNSFLSPYCNDDMNAGAFHLVLTNKLGLEGTSFVADVENGRQVWNHNVSEFVSTVVNAHLPPTKNSAPETIRRIHLRTDATYVMEIRKNSWEPVLGTDAQINKIKKYEYILDLDRHGNIIGGDWISNDRPDFIWTMEKVSNFTGEFARLAELLND